MLRPTTRERQRLPVKALQCVRQGRAVGLSEDVRADLNGVLGVDPEDVRVVRSVMERTHGDSILNDRFSATRVRPDVSGGKELPVAKAAQ
jgi:hypothetical protein